MKFRIEPEGIHFYDRINGTHVLLDEMKYLPEECSIAPRTVSIAITNDCNLSCSHCHISKGSKYLICNDIVAIARQLDKLGTLDIAIGGGEPTLHSDLAKICERIWAETDLGISITTNATCLNKELIKKLKGNVSFIRVSIDGVFKTYESIRKTNFSDIVDKIENLKNEIPFGLNVVINEFTIDSLDEVLLFALKQGAIELLLLPMVKEGNVCVSEDILRKLDSWIILNHNKIALRVLSLAKIALSGPFLFESEQWENDYAYISPELEIKRDSYSIEGEKILDLNNLRSSIEAWKSSTTGGCSQAEAP